MLYRKKTINNVATLENLSGAPKVQGVPLGTILAFYGDTLPSDNWLLCNGDTFDVDKYPALYMFLGSNLLPDLRECVLVGADKNTTNIFDSTETNPTTQQVGTQAHDVYTLGQFKDDQFQGHWHRFSTNGNDKGKGGMHSAYGGGDGPYDSSAYPNGILTPQSMANMGNVRYGTTTHGKQVGVNYIIKATSELDSEQATSVFNQIKHLNDYSTEETLTGGTWIDGKPIYRKVFDNGSFANNLTIDISSLNIETLIKSEVLGSDNNNGLPPIWTMSAASGLADKAAFINTSYEFKTTGSYYKRYVILEYTKTTDTAPGA